MSSLNLYFIIITFLAFITGDVCILSVLYHGQHLKVNGNTECVKLKTSVKGSLFKLSPGSNNNTVTIDNGGDAGSFVGVRYSDDFQFGSLKNLMNEGFN